MLPDTRPELLDLRRRIDAEIARRDGGDKAIAKRRASQRRGLDKLADRRRFKITPVPLGETARVISGLTGAAFQNKVKMPGQSDRVLTDGASNCKIGGDVLVGRLKGARIVTLTLEERATCPRSCRLWDACYGNGMPLATRWTVGPALEVKLRAEVAELCARHELVLVRLHVLGDFPSTAYVRLWAELLTLHPGLHVFGFTAHAPASEIGAEIAQLRTSLPDRFCVRHSERTGEWGSFTIDFPTAQARIGDALVCPEQRDAMNGNAKGVHCGSCGACWAGGGPIAFVLH